MEFFKHTAAGRGRPLCSFGITWLFAAAIFLTFSAGRCSSRQETTEEKVTSFKAGQAQERPAGAEKKAEVKEKTREKDTETEAPPEEPEEGLVIAAGGDIILHGRVKQSAKNQAAWPSEEGDSGHEGWWHTFKGLKAVLEKADIAVANLETPIAKERKKPSGRPPVLNGPKACLAAMKEAGFTIMNIANNHAFDQMREGVGETLDAVEHAGMDFTGAGHSRQEAETPLVREAGGVKAAFLGWTVTLNKNFNDVKTKHKPWVNVYKEGIATDIIKAVRPGVDLVVVNMHWGGEFDLKTGAKQKSISKALCGAGADIIIGHGPHILHEVSVLEPAGEEARKCIVAYSLGNLLSNQGLKYRYGWKPPNLEEAKNIPYTRDGIILRIAALKKNGKISFDRIEAVPVWTENNWIDRYVCKTVPPDDIYIVPIIPLLKSILEKNKKKLLLQERLAAIKEMVGNAVQYVEE